jgi:hypothetical protein
MNHYERPQTEVCATENRRPGAPNFWDEMITTAKSIRLVIGISAICVEWSRQMPDTHCATPRWRPTAPPRGCAMIFRSLGPHAQFVFAFRDTKRNTPMMAADRSTCSCRAILFLFVLIALPAAAASTTLEDSAKELARKIAAALPTGENASCEIRNISSLQTGDVARVEQALKAELQERGVRLTSGGAAITVVVTLSQNFESLVWTGEIHEGDTTHVVLIAVERSAENHASSSKMPVAIHREKFWEGPERILDAGEISDGAGKSWLVLLLPGGLLIQDTQTGLASTIDIASNQRASRDPWGNLGLGQPGNMAAFFLAPQMCAVNLETSSLAECLATEGSTGGPLPGRSFPMMIDLAPPGPPPPGKGTEIEMKSVCGGADEFLATGARDYTQPDSLQVFQTEPSGAVAVSTELDFPGPILALHAGSDTPRAVVRNLTTGNYEAYRLSFSCGQ